MQSIGVLSGALSGFSGIGMSDDFSYHADFKLFSFPGRISGLFDSCRSSVLRLRTFPRGSYDLQTWLSNGGKPMGALFVYVSKK